MFESQTLFVIGAGASHEAELPLGSGLTKQIAQILSIDTEFGNLKRGDHKIYEALKQLVEAEEWRNNNVLISGRQIADAMVLAPSIDTFLESHRNNREFVQLGKLGIVRAISVAEKNSLLAPVRNNFNQIPISAVANTWYYSLAQQLFSGVPADRPMKAFENVKFIVFNYDRCLQVFLQRAAEVYFRLSTTEAATLVKQVEIIHPYGSLGSAFEGDADFVPFASNDFSLLPVSRRIRTFSESSDLTLTIRQKIFDADTIIFLGFGFHPQNIDLLDVSTSMMPNDPRNRRIFATTKGMSTSDESIVRELISYAIYGGPSSQDQRKRIFTNNGTCSELFATYWRSLTA